MFNSVVLVGRAVDAPTVKQLESGVVVGHFTLAVARTFKSPESNTETDFFVCTCWNSVAMSAKDFVKKGSLILVKATLMMRDDTYKFKTEENETISKKIKICEINVDRIVYLKL